MSNLDFQYLIQGVTVLAILWLMVKDRENS